jgi:hypothetical protein
MPFSQVDIANMALIEVPAPRISSFDDDTEEARNVRQVYQFCLELMLQAHDWDFEVQRASLTPLATNDRSNEWGYAYQLPSDGITPRVLRPADPGSTPSSTIVAGLQTVAYPVCFPTESRLDPGLNLYPFTIANGILYTNLQNATLEYSVDNAGEGEFSALFANALALEIASRIVMPLRQDTKRQDYLIGKAEIARQRAIAADMNRVPRQDFGFISADTIVRSQDP